MTDISFNPSLKGAKGHQSIGSGGSFWLPPKMKVEKFESGPQKFSNTSGNPKNQNLSSQSEPFALPPPKSKNYNSQLRPADTNRGHFPAKINSPEVHAQSIPSHAKQILVTPSKSPISPILATPSGSLFANHLASNSRSVPLSPDHPLAPSANHSQLNGQRTFSSNGTGNAVPYGLKDESLFRNVAVPAEDFMHKQSKPLTEDELVDEIKQHLSDAPFHFSFQKGVMRFAFSLENGSSVSVRMEQMKENLRICFISGDPESLQSLANKFSSSSPEFDGSALPLEFHFFSSYQQMDDVFSVSPKLKT